MLPISLVAAGHGMVSRPFLSHQTCLPRGHLSKVFTNPALDVVVRKMSIYRRIQIAESGEVTVVKFTDRKILDEVNIQELGQELFKLVEQDNRRKLILNFSNVEFLSSAALGKLITFEKKARNNSASLILTNIRPEIYEVFAITRLNKLFVIKNDEADALAMI